ncbi:flavodoxin-cytochrome P450 XplA [Rhodococcus triatomae BKS 15-14]|nr:flavodoxin-cytochrome P450 XplA [Rhodococcus triatomae BKS 15-14]
MTIIFGTETGNSEMVADDLCISLEQKGITGRVVGMEDYDVEKLGQEAMAIMVTSTYGEGELPNTAQPFAEALETSKPDLSSMHFAAFGLGDSTYETYNRGIDTLIEKLVDLGATQVGLTGHHDADSGLDAAVVAVDWLKGIFVEAEAS